MRHRVAGRKLGRTSSHREAMLRNLVSSLFEHGRVVTTLAKAKEARPLAERLITRAKAGLAAFAAAEPEVPALKAESDRLRAQREGTTDAEAKRDLDKQIIRAGKRIASIRAKSEHHRRMLLSDLHHKNVVVQLFDAVAPRYVDRPGGYTRILKAGFRKGDNAPIAIFELV